MGVPKFFRWLSERYPAISQLIAENRIPEFDCLYLDMNGIIHNCTHKDSGDTTFRISEDEMFIRIFNYIEHLFGKIKPKQLFFMAIDGVAPRAKMNQQRSRRFRTALDAEQARDKAIREGKELPKEEPFDSNCITPGTEFMAKLTQQLKYFINKKVSEDSEWQGCEIVLSGHEVPGEGEHKIMEYIRNAKAQPGYNPNVRHCLYGLDADLIMLGLLSHDPHFCLLREEVTFGRQSKVKSKELEHQNFYLMHLCIVREYLELEFQGLKAEGVMKFPFDMEKVIDDFILMAFFVGNDFLPNLPHLHINEGALASMFDIYKRVLPQCDGYINEGGVINTKHLGMLLAELSKQEFRFFEHEIADEKWFRAKQMSQVDAPQKPRANGKGKLTITTSQKQLWKSKIRKFVKDRPSQTLDLGSGLNAADRKFVQDVADSFHMSWSTKEDEDGHRHLLVSFPEKKTAGQDEDEDEDEEEEEEGHLALLRVMKKYDNAEAVDVTSEDAQAEMDAKYKQKFQEWKDKYYSTKFEDWTPETMETELTKLCENYVQGLQWVLFYYYRGIASWPWFYRYHYSPMISDVRKGLNADLNFKLGQPFKPFEQLMGVLPDRSKKIVPKVYWDLMTNPESPIIDFYPRDFELDMNGKKMEWEAVVKIPFIEETRLLKAMGPKNALLSDDEHARNDFGVPLKFVYSDEVNFTYPSSLVGIFPDIPNCHCVENMFDLPATEGLDLYQGLVDGAKLNVEALAGFPSLATLPYAATLGFHGVNVFNNESRNESMVVTLSDSEMLTKIETAKMKLGQRVHVGYPFLQEAKVVRVSDELFDYTLAENGAGRVIQKEHTSREIEDFTKKSDRIEQFYSKRLGIIIGQVESMVHVEMLKGLMKTDEGATIKEFGDIPGMELDYAAQVIVDEVVNEDERFIERAALPIEEEFPLEEKALFLGDYNYGRVVKISGHSNNKLHLWLSALKTREPDFAKTIISRAQGQKRYTPSYAVAKQLNMHPLILSKITSSFHVWSMDGSLKMNLGLNLKFESKKQKVLGYTQKSGTGWEFSPKATELLKNYMIKFPEFFAGITQNPTRNEVNDTDIWPDPKTAQAKVKEIGAWLKTQETGKFERVPLDAEQLDSDVVMALHQATREIAEANKQDHAQPMKGVPRNAVLRQDDAEQRLGNQKFGLGDRVVYAQGSGKVPFTTRGTVVGITRVGTRPFLDVLFDDSFLSGTTLDGRCPQFHGMTVPVSSVLNLTNRQVVAGTRATMARKPLAPSLTTLTAHGGYGSPGFGQKQYRDAPAPGPLQGSWRGAINGSNAPRGRGHRSAPPQQTSRGGPLQLMPSSMVYRPSPNDQPQQVYGQAAQGQGQPQGQPQVNGNGFAPRGRGAFMHHLARAAERGRGRGRGRANFVPAVEPHQAQQMQQQMNGEQSYNFVPPPSNLDSPRGRGRGRGRGGRGRGRGGAVQSQTQG